MPYWGDGADECDYAFDGIGTYVVIIRDRMLKDIANVIQRAYPEQGITASIACLRVIGERAGESGLRRVVLPCAG
jgi:hypothetical protein